MNNLVIFKDAEKRFLESGFIFWDGIFVTYFTLGYWVWMSYCPEETGALSYDHA